MKLEKQHQLMDRIMNGALACDSMGNVYTFASHGPFAYHWHKKASNLDQSGYERMTLHQRDSVISFRVHQFVWLSFHGIFEPSLEINHIDGVRNNNCLSNLELITKSENLKHSYTLGNRSVSGSNNPRAKLTKIQVIALREQYDSGVPMNILAHRFNITKDHASKIGLRKSWNEIV